MIDLAGPRYRWYVLIGLPAACIAALIDRRSIWLDEAFSIHVASKSPAEMAAVLKHVDGVFALYYGLLHLWMALGREAAVVRLLSALAALATLPVFFLLGRRMLGAAPAFLATLLLGTSFIFLRYAVEARAYALEFLCCTAAAYFFVRFAQDGGRTDLCRYVIACALAAYFHPLAVVWPVALGASLPVISTVRQRWLECALASMALLLLLVPLVLIVRLNGTHQIDWIRPLGAQVAGDFFGFLFGGGSGGPLSHSELAIATFALCAAGLFLLYRARSSWSSVLLVWFTVPLLLCALISILKPVSQPYYFREVMLAAFLCAGYALAALNRRSQLLAALAAALVIGAQSWQAFAPRGEDWRTVVHVLAARTSANDALVVYAPFVILPLDYAQREQRVKIAAHVLYPVAANVESAPPEPLNAHVAGAAAARAQRVWLVLSHDRARGRNRSADRLFLQAGYRERAVTKIGAIRIFEMERTR